MPGALSGFKVVDLTSVVMGPYATQIFGDMGAEVIKVESPQGDIMRHMGATRGPAMGPIHLSVNRNKRSLVLDLRQPAAHAALLRVAGDADVFVHSMRPDAIERLGLGYEAIAAVAPGIIYCGAYGYGKSGPYALEPAYDDMIQGMCGLADSNKYLAGEPRFTPTIVADKVAGLSIAYAVLAALLHRQRTGEGQSIEVPMFESLASFMLVEHLWERAYDPKHGAVGYPRVLSQLRKPHRTLDGFVCVLPYTDRNWRDFFALAERPELAVDPRYATAAERSKNYGTLYQALGDIIATRATATWIGQCRARSIPIAPVNSLQDLFEDPHLQAVGAFIRAQHPSEGEITQVRPPVNFSKTACAITALAPGLGEHSHAILRQVGLSDAAIAALAATGATVGGAPGAPGASIQPSRDIDRQEGAV
ncbi:CaiB/BaiF CoA transferase family protein [Verminephrobacter eiseniae]|uniref:CaiB/BaiF CoA transferase family protein n=1 Tax=Verminephrobacter eiseniae TaxID=364317 RepID=UPI002237C14A|nr:CoA transferase [Verminephrobacter eiseniae]MCW5233057.1 CoA transferase [Verminephrobacter eiseniae]MCW5295387.1 CoA transferase [Verminephrobacter eiseniae]MCW8186804.1 CoA transferase [Verminephrobacter eiseniae]MCW8222948.1 CoA transferase [Verminephrobacter eiseniae]MCW8233150.1 CoA transferase [Verminephrobacter eiseniae]